MDISREGEVLVRRYGIVIERDTVGGVLKLSVVSYRPDCDGPVLILCIAVLLGIAAGVVSEGCIALGHCISILNQKLKRLRYCLVFTLKGLYEEIVGRSYIKPLECPRNLIHCFGIRNFNVDNFTCRF